jgi:glycosyltransferase involved in cell wall biosynthesis
MIDSLAVGGTQKMQVTLAAAARARNIPLTIISLGHDRNTPLPDALRALGARVWTFPARHLLDPQRLWRLVRVLRGERFAVLHTHLTYANIVGTLVGRLVGVPVVASLRSEAPFERPAIHRLEMWLLRHAAQQVMAVGQAVATAHREPLRHRPIRVVPNAVYPIPPLSPAERTAVRTGLVGNPARPVLISVGRLEPPKGFPDLLQAFAALRATHPAACLVIIGDGALRAQLAAQIAALHLEGHARLLGMRHDVPRLLAASDIYVSASHWEGLPVSILEAMAAGLPIVATTVGSLPQVVVAGTGVLVPPQAPARLTSALQALLEHPARQHACGVAARAHVAHTYSPDAWFEQLLRLYQSVGTLAPLAV